MSYAKMTDVLKKSKRTGGKFKRFSGSSESHYMREIEDKSYALSLNYFHQTECTVSVQLNGWGEGALTKFGKQVYRSGENTYFGLVCGDHYVSSYQVGTLLLASLVIEFKSHAEKTSFESKKSGSWGDIMSASSEIQRISSQYQISGSASIRAMQIGGDPVKLGGVFSKDKNGHYHVVHCSLNAMDQCVNAAGGLLDYVSKSLPTQASFEGGTGLVPLGLQHVQYKKIERIGLKAPTSFVTRAVCMARAELAKELEANEYYADKLHQLIHKYPVKWDESSATYKALEPLYERAMRNIAILDGDDGVMGCFNSPEECLALAAKATSQLKSITQEELETLSAIKHSYQYKGGLHYGDISFFHFDGAQYTADQSPDRTDPSRVEVRVDAKKCLIDVADHSRCGGGAACLRVVLQFGRTQSNFDQSGLTCTFPGGIGTVTRQTSPFHIEPFNMSLDSRDIDCERLPMPGASTQYDTEL